MAITKYILAYCFLFQMFGISRDLIPSFETAKYIAESNRIVSPENTTYYIDPNKGNDENIGTDKKEPWKTFKNINHLVLSKGNNVEILSAGEFRESLFLIGEGTNEFPITINFARGRYDFFPQNAVKRKFHISNTNDAPDSLKAIAFYFYHSKNININAIGADIIFRGKVIEVCIDSSENININGFNFDYYRPTVSEFKITSVNPNSATAQIHKDSKYKIVDGSLIWLGEGWQHEASNLWQIFNPQTQNLKRHNFPINKLHFLDISTDQIKISFDKNPGFRKNNIYQNRNTFRDYAAVFIKNCKDISWSNANVFFMHGMGFVSQVSENISFNSFYVGPRKGSGRTSAAWADIFHFANCKGKIKIKDSYLSSANDDAINVHGIYLRITKILSNKKIIIRYMHPQTFGFNTFFTGDSVEFVRSKSLLPFSQNIVVNAKLINEKEIELTLQNNIPDNIEKNDVVGNITWMPDVKITDTKISKIPTRGILITTSGKVIIENNEIVRTNMSGILIADDANSWFESGYVKNVTIRNNKFIECGEPVINISPENSEIIKNQYVHKNIEITNNLFRLKDNLALSAKSTYNLRFLNNVIKNSNDHKLLNVVKFYNCSSIKNNNNSFE